MQGEGRREEAVSKKRKGGRKKRKMKMLGKMKD